MLRIVPNKFLLITLSLLLPMWLKAQVITGSVYSSGSNTPLAGASVYYNGSMTGTSTDKDGSFSLPAGKVKMPIVVSCVGYISTTVNDYSTAAPLKIYLKSKIKELRSITVTDGKGPSRESMLRTFKREFIGTTNNASSCTILNADEIEFSYSRKTHILIASCANPIQIENKRLGYHLSYYLDYFKMDGPVTSYNGNFIFIDAVAKADSVRIAVNRERTYEGSRMQFIRDLWNDKLDDDWFSINNDIGEIAVDSIVVASKNAEKYVVLPHKITILYHDNANQATTLSSLKPKVRIGENGFAEDYLQWLGDMAIERVGDLLPYEYQPQKKRSTAIPVTTKRGEKSNK